MKETPQDRISFAIKSLEDALKKCENVNYTDKAGTYDKPTFVIGWTIGVLRSTIVDLKQTLKDLNK